MALLSLQATDGLLLDLTHTLASEIKFRTDLLKSHFLASYAEKHFEDFTLPVMELLESAVYLLGERLLGKCGICHGGIVVGEHIKEAIVFTLDKGASTEI